MAVPAMKVKYIYTTCNWCRVNI